MISRLHHDDRGSVLTTALILMVVMFGLGLALLSVVDVQSRASGTQREGDAAFNLADTTLASTAFVLSKNWPETASAAQPWTQAATCRQQNVSGGVAATSDTTIAGRIQTLVRATSVARNGPATATWKVNICDAGSATTWTDALLDGPAYDTTGRRTLPSSTATVRRMWVRAEAVVNGERRAASSLVQVGEKPAFPAGYGVLAGKMSFLNGVNTTTDALLTDGALLNNVLNPLLSTQPMVTGKIGIRCGLLSDLCVDAVAATLTALPLTQAVNLTSGQVVQYGSPTAVPADTIRLLREKAVGAGTYATSVASGASCIPAGTTVSSTSIVFVEKVGNGAQTCTIPAVPSRAIGTVVIGSGRISVTSTSPGTLNTLTGVLYALNRQDDRQSAVVTVNKGAKIRGAVFADGGGVVAVYPPDFSLTTAMCGSLGLVQRLLCVTLSGLGLVDFLLDALSLNQLLGSILPQLNGYGPIIEYDSAVVANQSVFGSSGVVQNTFRQIPAGS